MKIWIIALLAGCQLLAAAAQGQNGKITGIVKAEGKGLGGVSVSLLRSLDSFVVKTQLTDPAGRYQFSIIGDGNYLLRYSSVGFENYLSPVLSITGTSEIDLGIVNLVPAAKNLSAVTITAKRPPIEQKIDRLVVNVDASPSNAGATAMEVLEKSPGIIVNNDGGISLKGKPGVIVMMDGKPTFLSASDLANLLKNTPASAIDQIEIMSNPSSKFDASGNAGIINIKTKKSLKMGWNGSITLGASAGFIKQGDLWFVNPRSQNSVNFNYRKNKINVYGNYNPNFNKGRNSLTLNRRFYNPDGSLNSSADLNTRFVGTNNNHNLKLGVDYYVSKKDVVGVVFTGFGFFGKPGPTTFTNIYEADGSLSSSLASKTTNQLSFKNFTANINYKHSFDSTGREISLDVDYVRYDNRSNMTLYTSAYDKWGNSVGDMIQLKGRLPSDINIYSVKTDYAHPLGKDLKLEAGIKANYIKNDNMVDYNRLQEETWVPDSRSNHFIYEENINAAYISLNKKISEKWSAQAGLRAENTNTKGYQVTNDSTFRRHYTNLFPSAFVSYAVDKNNQLTVSYSRRINRPNYENLNPFTFFLDSLTYKQGNPYLMPQMSHNIELGHTFKHKYIVSVNYTKTSNVISELIVQNTESKTTYATTANIARFRNIGVSVTAPFKWTPWWSTNIFTNVFNNRYEGVYAGKDPVDLSNTAVMVNLSNTFTIQQGFTAELSGFYRSKVVDQMLLMDPMYQMNIAVQKNILKGKGSLRLNIRDPFGWQKFSAWSRYGDVDVKIANRWDSRQVSASVTYRFGKNTIAPSRRRTTGVSEELNRAGQGN